MALRNLALAVFFGGGLATLLATRALFRAAESRKQGGYFSGAVLRSFQELRWWALVALIAVLHWRPLPDKAVAAALVVLAAAGAAVDRRIRSLRDQIGGSTEGLAADDPRRKRFGALHGVSVLLLIAQTLIAAAALALQLQ